VAIFKLITTNLVTSFIVFAAVEIVLVVFLYIVMGRKSPFSIWRLLGCIVLNIAFVAATFLVLFTGDYQASPVDASPIAEISSGQITHLEDAIDRFEELEFIIRWESDVKSENHYLRKTYSFYWKNMDPESLLNITVFLYKDEQRAIHSFELSREGKHTYINNGNNTEVLLFDAKMIRTSDTYYTPDTKKYIKSEMRIGDAIIKVSESQKFYNLDKNITNKFIVLLCDILNDAE